ncbi:MAG: VWA domain-containing protein [Candidatus Hatepunaea meridiana]|nr:VWA domain-containing protein [Candidatus Hatepunaea meridiana]
MIRFAHPEYLYFLWCIPLLSLLIWWEYRWQIKTMHTWAKEKLWDAALPNRAPGRKLIRRILILFAIMLLIFSASGPQVGTRMIEVIREGSDIAIAVDVSESMLAEDITPNRMMKAQHEIVKFLGKLRGDRVALVPFAGVAFVQVPLTLDYAAVNSILHALEPGMIPQPGTSISAAINQARRAFREEGKAQKIIILISDGEDHEEGAIEAAKEAAKESVIIYTVGMASPSGGPVPIKNERGKVTGYKKEKSGGTVISRLNEKLLTDIARITGGEFYRATSIGGEFNKIYKQVAGLDKEQFEAKEYTDFEHRFQWPLAAAFLLVVIGEIIPTGRRRKK